MHLIHPPFSQTRSKQLNVQIMKYEQENTSSLGLYTWEDYYRGKFLDEHTGERTRNTPEMEKDVIRRISSKGVQKHFLSHVANDAEHILLYEGEDSYREVTSGTIQNFFYDVLLCYVLNIDLPDNFLAKDSYNAMVPFIDDAIKDISPEFLKNFRKLSREGKEWLVEERYASNAAEELRKSCAVLGYINDFDISFNQIVSIPACSACTYESGEKLITKHVPLIATPIFVEPINYYIFANGVNGKFIFSVSDIPEVTQLLSQKRETYWHKLTGKTNPSTPEIKDAVLKTQDFSVYF